jgi:hypothetical protein
LSKKSQFFERHPFELIHLIEESPPPLGFWTIITTTSRKQTIVIKTKKIENVLIV